MDLSYDFDYQFQEALDRVRGKQLPVYFARRGKWEVFFVPEDSKIIGQTGSTAYVEGDFDCQGRERFEINGTLFRDYGGPHWLFCAIGSAGGQGKAEIE